MFTTFPFTFVFLISELFRASIFGLFLFCGIERLLCWFFLLSSFLPTGRMAM